MEEVKPALTAEMITKSIQEKGVDPRVSEEDKFELAATQTDLFAKLRLGIDYWHFLKVGDIELPFRLLSIKEVNDIDRAALIWYNGLKETERMPQLLFKKRQILTIVKALNSSSCQDTPKSDYKYFIDEQTLEHLPDAIFINWFTAYADLCRQVDKNIDYVTEEEYKDMIESLKKNPVLVKELSRPRLEQIFIQFLADTTSLTDRLRTASLQDNIATS